jgi:hypothetical protein
MDIVVCLKQTFDTEAKIVIDGKGKIDPTGVNLVINPYDEFAVEEALKLKEKFGGQVTLVSMGESGFRNLCGPLWRWAAMELFWSTTRHWKALTNGSPLRCWLRLFPSCLTISFSQVESL